MWRVWGMSLGSGLSPANCTSFSAIEPCSSSGPLLLSSAQGMLQASLHIMGLILCMKGLEGLLCNLHVLKKLKHIIFFEQAGS